uniref:Uncharacterized LOC100182634 n=2 Tax=Ciona intestinalis TaxID=7719 RepID=H2XKL1_CIOIN
MDELSLFSELNEMNLNRCMEDISRKILDRQNKIIIRLSGSASTYWKPLVQCLGKISELQLDMRYISKEELQLLKEEIQQLPCPQDFNLNVIEVTAEESSEGSYYQDEYYDEYYDEDYDYY